VLAHRIEISVLLISIQFNGFVLKTKIEWIETRMVKLTAENFGRKG
jgi:hypothetical protein